MRYAALVLAIIALPCTAGQVYKCKGPKGEVTFTNIKCPEKTEATQVGTYEKAADSPDQLRDALSDAAARRARENATQDASALPADTQPEDTSDAAAAATRDRRSIAGRQQIDADAASDAAKDAKYRADLKRWGKRMAGDPPPGYDERNPQRQAARGDDTQNRGPETQFCNQAAGGEMTCFGTHGTISQGHVDQQGNATMFKSTGGIQQMQVAPNAGTNCVSMDASGNCN